MENNEEEYELYLPIAIEILNVLRKCRACVEAGVPLTAVHLAWLHSPNRLDQIQYIEEFIKTWQKIEVRNPLHQ